MKPFSAHFYFSKHCLYELLYKYLCLQYFKVLPIFCYHISCTTKRMGMSGELKDFKAISFLLCRNCGPTIPKGIQLTVESGKGISLSGGLWNYALDVCPIASSSKSCWMLGYGSICVPNIHSINNKVLEFHTREVEFWLNYFITVFYVIYQYL